MTIGAWVGFWVIVAVIAAVAISIIAVNGGNETVIIPTIVTALALIIWIFFAMKWWYSCTESGKRAMKTQVSNFEGGIKRSVKVYDAVGNVIQEYTGTFDVDFGGDEKRILFDDQDGYRHVIYFKTGTVIVEEIK